MSDQAKKDPIGRLGRDMIQALAGVVRMINPELADHCRRVARGARVLAQTLGWSPGDVLQVYLGGFFHDLGYISDQKEGLNGWLGGGVSNRDYGDAAQDHPLIGEQILAGIDSLTTAALIIRQHHEHYNGSGFPDGLKGKEIVPGARLLAIVDFFERMTVARSGTNPLTIEEACQIIREDAGIIYDPVIVPVFLEKVLPTGVLNPPAAAS